MKKMLGSYKLAHQSRSISLYFAFLKSVPGPSDILKFLDLNFLIHWVLMKKCQYEEKWDLKNADFWYFGNVLKLVNLRRYDLGTWLKEILSLSRTELNNFLINDLYDEEKMKAHLFSSNLLRSHDQKRKIIRNGQKAFIILRKWTYLYTIYIYLGLYCSTINIKISNNI